MSRKEKAAFAHLRRQVSMLETWGRSLDNMITETPKGSADHWSLIRDRQELDAEIASMKMVRRELNRATHRVRQSA